LVQAYCRQSIQKWNVPAKWSLEGDAVDTFGSSSGVGSAGVCRPNRASMPRPPSAAGFASGAVDV